MRVEHAWQPTPWYLRWRGRERRQIIISTWVFDFVVGMPSWEYC